MGAPQNNFKFKSGPFLIKVENHYNEARKKFADT